VALSVAVIIPTLNEETTVAASIASARAAGAAEIVVSDGGSTDATVDIAKQAGATAIASECLRARQMNRAAETTSADILLFLHGDTLLPHDAAQSVRSAIEMGYPFGGFRLRFLERSRRLAAVAAMINIRSAMTRCPWGDQAQFVARERFLAAGGFREIPIMEDYDFAVRMKRLGETILLPQYVRTSGRRFLTKGIVATTATNWRIVVSYRLGADPARLASIYRDGSDFRSS